MVDHAKREFVKELKELLHFFNNIKSASKQNEEQKSDIFRNDADHNVEDTGFEFKFDVNPFDKKVLQRKQ